METPRYEFSKKEIVHNTEKILSEWLDYRLFYSMQANDYVEVLKLLKEQNIGFCAYSVREYERVRSIGVEPERIIFKLPIKTEETIIKTYNDGCRYYEFDDMRELQKLQKIAPLAIKILRIQVSDLHTSGVNFGMNYTEIENNLDTLLNIVGGISFDISQDSIADGIPAIFDRVKSLLDMFQAKQKTFIVNVGGIISNNDDQYSFMNDSFHDLICDYGCQLYAEPGEVIIATAGAFYAKVIAIKECDSKRILYLDGGLANGLGNFMDTREVVISNRSVSDNNSLTQYIVRDCTCLNRTYFEFVSKDNICVDDVLRIENMGAYSLVYCNEFHKWSKCDVTMID